ncbi:kinase-like domain-containing protein [Irpex rosettiformis]|uniref:Kinase-like domain-containing protein n=1 Tax=Irpex rosettiformis TaxID=378272 RepID=A0ACB8U2T0_9APHY|nr:kinase-like domain-containing protein [Irpex rosettiformis]
MEKSVPIRFRILQAAYPDSFLQNAGSPDSNITATLYNAALQETIDNKPRICANALYSMRGQQATDTMGLIQNDLSLTLRDAVPRRRDAMRRMLTHMAQESNSLPSSLLVPAESTLHAVDGGAYGTIDVGSLYGKKVAMKAIRIYPRTGNTLSRLRQMYLEVLTCQSLSSPRVIQLYGISESRGMAWIVIPYFSRGNAIGYLARVRGSPVYQNGGLVALVNKWIFHLADGMRYLHEEGIVHGDIRGVNLLIDDAEGALIGDFGLSIFANGESKQYWSRRSGSMQWLAPEVMGQSESTSSRPTRDSDVYSFSHVCVELYTGQPPYRFKGTDIKDSELRYIIISQKQRPPLPAIDDLSNLWPMDEKLYELLQRCWDEKPENRPQMVNVVHSLQDLISM